MENDYTFIYRSEGRGALTITSLDSKPFPCTALSSTFLSWSLTGRDSPGSGKEKRLSPEGGNCRLGAGESSALPGSALPYAKLRASYLSLRRGGGREVFLRTVLKNEKLLFCIGWANFVPGQGQSKMLEKNIGEQYRNFIKYSLILRVAI